VIEDRARHLGIVELHDICERLAARHEDLFRMLGGWVADTPDPAAQQLFSEACHRHAWHAELWRGRSPAIPADAAPDAAATATTIEPDAADRLAAYTAAIVEVSATTQEVAGRADPVLDPSTHRVASLTLTDLTDLVGRAAAIS